MNTRRHWHAALVIAALCAGCAGTTDEQPANVTTDETLSPTARGEPCPGGGFWAHTADAAYASYDYADENNNDYVCIYYSRGRNSERVTDDQVQGRP